MAELVTFLNNNPSRYHIVAAGAAELSAAGFTRLTERESWSGRLTAGEKYFFTRDGTALFAFVAPHAETRAFSIASAHCDCPCLRLKPRAKPGKDLADVAIEAYGGGQWQTWLDRPLGVAGRVVSSIDGKLVARLFAICEPIMIIPSLAIHLRTKRDDVPSTNLHDHFAPFLGLSADHHSPKASPAPASPSADSETENSDGPAFAHHVEQPEAVLDAIRAAAGLPDGAPIVDLDAELFAAEPAKLVGLKKEFICAAGLDDRLMCFCGLHAFLAATAAPPSAVAPFLAIFNHEEVGSTSTTGANGPSLSRAVERILAASPAATNAADMHAVLARSFHVSGDNSHALHPSFASRSDPHSRIELGRGPVLKVSSRQAYATSAVTSSVVKAVLEGTPLQVSCNRADVRGGRTLGPMAAAHSLIPTADFGAAQLAMHSVLETCAAADVPTTQHALELLLLHAPERLDEVLSSLDE
jgi:aspartyl aminopeptidase